MIDHLYNPEYVAARRVLLDALAALQPHGSAVIVAGAQAVYLRTGSANLAIAPFTTDGDLALDPTQLGDDPRLGDAMESAGFTLHRHQGGHLEPGVWERSTVVDERDYLIPIDLIVPEAVAEQPGRRGARLGSTETGPPDERSVSRRRWSTTIPLPSEPSSPATAGKSSSR